MSGALPVPFIVGVGRSGTTLLRLMLDAHPLLCIPPETGFVARAAALLTDEARARDRFFELVTTFPTWPDFGLDTARFRQTLSQLEPFQVGDGVRAFYRSYAERHGKARYGDKSPTYTARLGIVQSVLPEARFIHVIRDGRDVALSHREVWFGKGNSVEEHIGKWRDLIRKARRLSRSCEHYLEVRYEDLVRNTVVEVQRICNFLQLAFAAQMLRYFEGASQRLDEVTTWKRADGTVWVSKEERLFQHRFTSYPPLESRVFRYKREMTDELRLRCEAIAGDLLEELGYETQRAAAGPSLHGSSSNAWERTDAR